MRTAGNLVPDYDDGAEGPNAIFEKEQAFRQGYLEEARRVVRDWAYHDTFDEHIASWDDLDDEMMPPCDPEAEIEAAWQLRKRVRERYVVYGAAWGPNCGGRKTYHLGYRPGHEGPAARLRGRHHALVFAYEPYENSRRPKVDASDPKLLQAWLEDVEAWAAKPIDPDIISPPPRLIHTIAAHRKGGK